MENKEDLKRIEEKSLAGRALSGEDLAWRQILIRYKRAMKKAIRSHISAFGSDFNFQHLEEAYQEALLKVHKSGLKHYIENQAYASIPLSSFLYKLASNVAKDYTKSKLGRSQLREQGIDSSDNPEFENTVFQSSFTEPLNINIEREKLETLRSEIKQLDPIDQNILLCHLDGDKHSDIALKYKKSEAQINKMIFSFKKYMKKKYTEK
ncbi:MAG: hypothetical protein KAG61_04965 [Bacteriovoracaceae bacterium]|nr:hypothetical protein [Bacteriovoracaceae bacterium]